jgi:quinoprotein glucose dehydrogenase
VEWPYYGGDPGATRYSTLTSINRGNVRNLQLAWVWRPAEGRYNPPVPGGRSARPSGFEATPIMIGDTLYLATPYNRVIALDASSGTQLWAYDPIAYAHGEPFHQIGFVHRGVAAWADGRERRIFLTSRWRLVALAGATGRPIPSFGHAGEVDLTEAIGWTGDRRHFGNTSPPAVYRDLVIVGSSIADELTYPGDPPGTVVALDARTGRVRWTFRTIPLPGEYGSETWRNGSATRAGHANVWSVMTVDTVRGLVYLPVSAAGNDWYGAHRPGDNLFAESIVCLDARTGRRVWHFQFVHHGLWDYDPAAPPTLITVRHEGKPVDAVVVAGKTGFLYVFDRVTGRPLWPIHERPVPQSSMAGELSSPTQPFPVKPAPFTRQGFTPNDVIDFTPELKQAALARLKRYRFGPLFNPPSLEGSIIMPGWIGGAAWGGGSYDPEIQTYYIKGNNAPAVARLVRGGAASDTIDAEFRLDLLSLTPHVEFPPAPSTLLSRFYRRRQLPLRLPINRPPYGTLTAIDLRTGQHRWQVPVGDDASVRNHPALKHVKLPRRLGAVGAAGPMVTSGGLVFVSGGSTGLYALDKETGQELWEADLGEPGYGNPMTYRTRGGRQFVLVAVGKKDLRLMAFALPVR